MSSCVPCCWMPETRSWVGPTVYAKLACEGSRDVEISGEGKVVASTIGDVVVPPGRYTADRVNPSNPYINAEVRAVDPKSNIAYWGESQGIVAFKAAGATAIALVPIYAIGNMFINLFLKLPVNLIECFRKYVCAIKKANDKTEVLKLTKEVVVDLLKEAAKGLWDVARVPFYAAALQIGLIYTAISPYNGRELVAKIERDWHGIDVSQDVRGEDNARIESFSGLYNLLNNKVSYLFFCYQPKASMSQDDQYIPLNPAPPKAAG